MSRASTMNTDNPGIPLDFDVWCEFSARLLQRDDEARLDILIEAEIDPLDWTRSEAHWSVEIVRDVSAGRMDRPRRYGARCASELLKRKERSEAVTPEPARQVAAVAADTGVAPIAAGGAALAVAQPLSAALAVPSPLAFTAPPALAPPVIVRPPSHLAATSEAFEIPSHLRTAAAALPFAAGAPSREFVADASAPRQAPSHSPALGATMPLNANILAQVQASLPFARKAGAEPKGQESRRLTLQAYASLCAELALTPEKSAAILAKYQIADAAMRRAVDDEWHARFKAHPEVHQEWQKLCAEYSAWLRQTIK